MFSGVLEVASKAISAGLKVHAGFMDAQSSCRCIHTDLPISLTLGFPRPFPQRFYVVRPCAKEMKCDVEVSTCPLWTSLLLVAYQLTHHPHISGCIVCRERCGGIPQLLRQAKESTTLVRGSAAGLLSKSMLWQSKFDCSLVWLFSIFCWSAMLFCRTCQSISRQCIFLVAREARGVRMKAPLPQKVFQIHG